MPDWPWPHHMQITITLSPSVEKLWTRTLNYLEDSQSKAIQKRVDDLTANLQNATQVSQQANAKLEQIEKENQT